ncbi:MAG: Crp/Fnr family transcriptional regulator [Chloroflexota bacterium]
MQTMKINSDDLGKLPLFAGFSDIELENARSRIHRKVSPEGSNFISTEQPGEVIYFIEKGTVKVHAEQADGSDVIIAILGPGEVVGEMALLEKTTRTANVVTLERTQLLWMTGPDFFQCLETIPAMSLNLLRMLSRRLRLSSAQIQSLAAHDVYGRVARQILAFAQEYGEPAPNGDVVIPLHLTQSEMADLVGASRVRVNQVLVYYKQQKYISVDQNHRISVHNQQALAERI